MKRRRPLLYVCTDPGIPLFGRKGSSTHVRELARAFAELGEDVWLAVSGPTGVPPPGFPCRLIPLPAPGGWIGRRLGFDLRLWLGARRAASALQSALREATPWAVYERHSLYGTCGRRLAARLALPRVLEVNALLAEEARTRLHFPRLAAALEAASLRSAPRIAAISITMKHRLETELGIPPERIFVSPMGIDPARFHPEVQGIDLRSRLRLSNGPLIGYVGSFNHYHRPGWLLDLAQALQTRGMAGSLVVIGGASEKVERHRDQARRRGLADRIAYVGEVAHDQLPEWLASLDLAVVPGAAPHSSPTKIVEAAALALPQILPDYPPVRYLVGDLGDEAFFPPENQEEFIERTIGALDRLERLRPKAQSLAPEMAEGHAWTARAAEILAALSREAG
jgi:glycosyltransferase involved in cell wall biosynthesis